MNLLLVGLGLVLGAELATEEKKNTRQGNDCLYPDNEEAFRRLQVPVIPSSICPKYTALELVPLVYEQFFNVVNAGDFQQVPGLIACDAIYTSTMVSESSPACEENVGPLEELLAFFYPTPATSKILSVKYEPIDGSVLVESVVAYMDSGLTGRIFQSKMVFQPAEFCEYKVAYWNLVEFNCLPDQKC